jgi:hypothetical protein
MKRPTFRRAGGNSCDQKIGTRARQLRHHEAMVVMMAVGIRNH